MEEKSRRLPSPTAVIAVLALIVTVGGGTLAVASSHHALNLKTVKRIARSIANKQITKRAGGLSVAHAATADSAASIAAPEAVHLVGQPGEPVFENGAKNVNLDYLPAGFYRDRECVVHLQGTVHATTKSAAFTLPPADRPPQRALAAVGVAGSVAESEVVALEVRPTGEVVPTAEEPNPYQIGLDGVTFRAANC